MLRLLLCIAFLITSQIGFSQQNQTENIVIITLDGFRWQELFEGADSAILFNKEAVHDEEVVQDFWHQSPIVRRERLMPFFWNVIALQGQLYGNRKYNNQVNCSNPYWFSYPGYNELLTGFVDRKVKSNDKINNRNSTVLEFINKQKGFENKVAAFSTWDVIPYVLNVESSKIYTNCGNNIAVGDRLTQGELLLNELQSIVRNPHGSRYDAFTFYYAMEYMKRERPRAVFISLDETDEHGHGGRYDEYLKSAHAADQMIADLWQWLQQDEQYAGKTSIIITTDHGRGKGAKHAWKSHGRLSFGSSQMWLAIIGPDTPARGEMKTTAQYFQKQVAKTAAAFLGFEYSNRETVGEVIKEAIAPSSIASPHLPFYIPPIVIKICAICLFL